MSAIEQARFVVRPPDQQRGFQGGRRFQRHLYTALQIAGQKTTRIAAVARSSRATKALPNDYLPFFHDGLREPSGQRLERLTKLVAFPVTMPQDPAQAKADPAGIRVGQRITHHSRLTLFLQ